MMININEKGNTNKFYRALVFPPGFYFLLFWQGVTYNVNFICYYLLGCEKGFRKVGKPERGIERDFD
ncbi:MAG: hypothetical protein AB2L14_23320 [Candidatus Xenobiia bacterium LiM19]